MPRANSEFCCVEGCNEVRQLSTRYCRNHLLQRKREQAKIRFAKQGRYRYSNVCDACGKTYSSTHKGSHLCKDCAVQSRNTGTTGRYESGHGERYCLLHRRIAKIVLGRKLNYNEVVHHINLVETDNRLENLMVMSRSAHGAFHSFLRTQLIVLRKAGTIPKDEHFAAFLLETVKAWLTSSKHKAIYLNEVVTAEQRNKAEALINEGLVVK